MYIPNIPSVTTSVIDRSRIKKTIQGKRTILLPGFFKYGKEGFMTSDNIDEFKFHHGRINTKKYGNAYLYGLAAAKTDRVISYRLVPDDATYANNAIKVLGDYESLPNIHSKEELLMTNGEIVLSAMATARGEGYNSIFITFKPATDFEKMDANVNGETNYKFNFVQAEIYEETVNGIKSLGDPVVFSLMEYDRLTDEPIFDKISGKNLFVNNIFKDANEFATLMVNEDYSYEMTEKANIDQVVDERLIIEDKNVIGKFYEIKVETYDKIVPDANGVNQRIPTQRLTTVITTTPATAGDKILKYDDGTGTEVGKRIEVDNSIISFVDVPVTADSVDYYDIDGQDAFYRMSVEDGTGEIKFNEINFLRHTIYTKLMNYSMKLYSGTDGEFLHVNGKLNLFGPSAPGKQNAVELMLDFYNNTPDLREVLYPKYDFDYMPDWTNIARVQQAIIGLADDIGVAMPILSCPLNYNPKIVTKDLADKDVVTRRENIFQSSYNSMLYSGQQNKTHRTDGNLRMYMPMSYYAMVAHLRIDNQYSITEPVANIIKGTLDSAEINLTYAPTSLEIESLRNHQINAVIVEPDGTYIIDQLTMYKRNTKLSRANIVKVLHRIRKDLPKLLKDLLQLKALGSIIGEAKTRTEDYLSKWLVTPENDKDGIFSTITVDAAFNEETYKLRLTITVNPIGTIESIDIPIIVI